MDATLQFINYLSGLQTHLSICNSPLCHANQRDLVPYNVDHSHLVLMSFIIIIIIIVIIIYHINLPKQQDNTITAYYSTVGSCRIVTRDTWSSGRQTWNWVTGSLGHKM